MDIVFAGTSQVITTRRFNSNPLPTLSCTQCAVQVKYSLFVTDFHRSQVNAGRTCVQSSSFFNRSTPELYSRVIYRAAPIALPTRKQGETEVT